MLNNPLTVGNVIVVNLISLIPIILLLGRGLWYLSRMTFKVEELWLWYKKMEAQERVSGG